MDATDSLIDEAFLYAYPLWVLAKTRHADLMHADPAQRTPPNALRHDRTLSDHTTRWITTPNNDTLYSRAWLDLSRGPVRVSVDAQAAGRYWSVAFLDAFGNNFAMLGLRLDGAGPATVTLVGPRHRGPLPAGRIVHAPGDDVWLLGRWIVDGPDDLPNAHAAQERLHVDASAPATAMRIAPADATSPAHLLAVFNEQLERNPPAPADAPLLARCAAVGLQPGRTDAWDALPPAIRDAWTRRLPQAQAALHDPRTGIFNDVEGWSVRPKEIGNFGTSYALRAAVALRGLGALEPIEAVYATCRADGQGAPLTGAHRYRLRLPPGGLPIDSFWSLSMYEMVADGRVFFTDNPIRRYTIGDRTPGLRYADDGTLEIALQHDAPDDPVAHANWLPAPTGPFLLSLRAYLPRAELREWRAPMPVLVTLG